MEAVNLLPPEYRERKRRRSAPADNLDGRKTLRLGGGVALLFAVLLGGLFFHEHKLVSSKTKELANNKAQIAAVQPQVDTIKTAQAAVSGRLSLATSITSTRMNWDKALNDFGKIIPTSSYLSSISVTAPVTAATAAAAAAAAYHRAVDGLDRSGRGGTFQLLDHDARRRRPEHAGCRPRHGQALAPPVAEQRHARVGYADGQRVELLQHDGKRLGGSLMARMNGIMGVVVSSVAVLFVVIVGWFFFVSPQRTKADHLSVQVSAAKGELASDEQLIATAKKQNTLANAKAAERALPDTPRVAEILRQLTALAAESRTELDSIAPGTPTPYRDVAGPTDRPDIQGAVLRTSEAAEADAPERRRLTREDPGQGTALHRRQHSSSQAVRLLPEHPVAQRRTSRRRSR